jgi:UDP:flavonoid glycosyltransferase YjiC (YdhE family)
MHICILSVGTRGDVQPYIALGKGLQTAGHQVQLATLGVFEPMVRGYGLDFVLFEESPLSFVERVIASSSNGVQRMLQTRRILMTMMEHLLEDAWHAVQGADLIITSNLLIYPGYAFSERLGIPSIGTFLVPYLRTRAFPNPAFCSGRHAFGGRGNLLTYDLFNEGLWQLYRGSMNRQRQRFGLSPLPRWGMARQMLREHYPFLCAYSPLVVPRPADWGANIHVTSYWFLDAPASWQPPDALLAFLEAGPPPVYIGLGSMKTRHPAATTELMVQALAQSGQRGLLLTSSSGVNETEIPDEVFTLTEAPHDWLFPRMAAVVHHGGAGTTAAGLRAGVPTMITPIYGDQFFWGQHIARLGVGPPPIPQKHLTVERLAAALRLATSDQAMQERARAVGQHLREEDGIAQAVRIIEAIRATQPGRLATY